MHITCKATIGQLVYYKISMLLTVIAVVVHQDYLFQKVGGRPFNGRVYGPQDDGQGFIHKNENNADLREF